jgi:hypothetical protein
VISAARSGSVVVGQGERLPLSNAARNLCPYWKSRLGGKCQGLISDSTTIVSSTLRHVPCRVLRPEMESSRSTKPCLSSRVVGRFDTANTSRSLRGFRPPRTADPNRYAPTVFGPRTSRTRATTQASCC